MNRDFWELFGLAMSFVLMAVGVTLMVIGIVGLVS